MPHDVFVSYSRKNLDLCTGVVDELRRSGLEVWVDVEGIPFTAEWMAEVRRGIEGSKTFLFLLSESSAASDICRQEAVHALDMNKPILVWSIDQAGRPAELARGAVVEGATGVTAAAAGYPAAARDLLVAALDWQAAPDASKLVRGSELERMEGVAASARIPVCVEYLRASQRRESQLGRRRFLLTVAAISVLALLGVLALRQRTVAIENTRKAEARRLAASAQTKLDRDPHQALELARQSLNLLFTEDAARTLRTAIERDRQSGSFSLDDATPLSAVFLDNRAVVADAAGLSIWDLETGKRSVSRKLPFASDRVVRSIPNSDHLMLLAGGRVDVVDGSLKDVDGLNGPFVDARPSRDGGQIAGLTPDGVLHGFGPGRAELFAFRVPRLASADSFVPTSDGFLFAGNLPSGPGLSVSDRAGTPLNPSDDPYRDLGWRDTYFGVTSLLAAGDGSRVLTGETNGNVEDYGTTLKTNDNHGGSGGIVTALAATADAEYIAAGYADGRIRVWRRTPAELIVELAGHSAPVVALGFSPSGQVVYSVSADATLRSWRVTEPATKLAESTYPITFDVSPDGSTVAFDASGFVHVNENGKEIASAPSGEEGVIEVVFGSDPNVIWMTSHSQLLQWKFREGPPVVSDMPGRQLQGVCPIPGTDDIILTDVAGTAQRLGPGAAVKWSQTFEGTAGCRVNAEADQVVIGAGNFRGAIVLSTADGSLIRQLSTDKAGANRPRFAPKSDRVAVATEFDVRIYDGSDQPEARLEAKEPADMGWSADERLMVVCFQDGTPEIRDTRTGAEVARLDTGRSQTFQCQIDPKGRGVWVAYRYWPDAIAQLRLIPCPSCMPIDELRREAK